MEGRRGSRRAEGERREREAGGSIPLSLRARTDLDHIRHIMRIMRGGGERKDA